MMSSAQIDVIESESGFEMGWKDGDGDDGIHLALGGCGCGVYMCWWWVRWLSRSGLHSRWEEGGGDISRRVELDESKWMIMSVVFRFVWRSRVLSKWDGAVFCSMVGNGKHFEGDWIGLFDIQLYSWLCATVRYVGGMEGMGTENLLCSKPPISAPNRLASRDLSRLPCDSLNVFCESKNGLLHPCWMLSS